MRAVAPLAAFASAACVALWWPAAHGKWVGNRWFSGDVAVADALARGVAASLGATGDQFATGSARFDGEWWFGTFQMAALGFGHLALQHPDHREVHLAQMERALDRLMDRDVAAFDAAAWHENPWDGLRGSNDHAAFLGYAALPFALHRTLRPGSSYDEVEASLIEALVLRFSRHDVLETYPGERYPVDNLAGIGAIALHDAATVDDHGDLVAAFVARTRERFVDPATGLLVQAVQYDGSPLDAPRGSGTALGAYFVSWADPALSEALWTAARQVLYRDVAGFGAMREYPAGVEGDGDIDSGPLVFGLSVSATGFALASARQHRDPNAFSKMYATTHLFGAPTSMGDHTRFATGGPLGDAILFAMLTAPEVGP